MLTTVKTITRRKQRNSASKSRKNYKKYKKKLREKSSYFIEERKTSTQKTHTKV
jgi:hypothetical protein